MIENVRNAGAKRQRSLWAVLPTRWRALLIAALLLVVVVNVVVVAVGHPHSHPLAAIGIPALSPWLVAGPGIYLMRRYRHERVAR